ncbi:MAG: mechanosensitive ion channel family protein, partial [Pseudomonadota bacterium]
MAEHETPTAPLTDEAQLEEVIAIGGDLLSQGQQVFESMFRTWNLYQILIALGVFIVAHVLRAVLGPRIRAWMGSRENWPKWRMRILVVIHQRLRAIFFVTLIW